MPVPLTTALLVLAAIFAYMGLEIAAVIIGGLAVANQFVVEIAASQTVEDPDGLG